jgi:hypothetical protein
LTSSPPTSPRRSSTPRLWRAGKGDGTARCLRSHSTLACVSLSWTALDCRDVHLQTGPHVR